jgi:hypothetical protein
MWLGHPATRHKASTLDLPSRYADLATRVLTDVQFDALGGMREALRPMQTLSFFTLLQLVLGWVGEWAYECVKCDKSARCEAIATSVFELLPESQTTRLNEKGGPRLETQKFMDRLGTPWDGSIGALTFSECREGPLSTSQQAQLEEFVEILFVNDSGRLFAGADLSRRVAWIKECHAHFRHEGLGHEEPSFYSTLQARLPDQWSFDGRIPWATDATNPRVSITAPGSMGWKIPGWTMAVQPVRLTSDCARAWVRWIRSLFADLEEPTCYMKTLHCHWRLLAPEFDAEFRAAEDVASIEAQRAAWRDAEQSLEDAFAKRRTLMKPFPTQKDFYNALGWKRRTFYNRLPAIRSLRDVIMPDDGPVLATPEAIAELKERSKRSDKSKHA